MSERPDQKHSRQAGRSTTVSSTHTTTTHGPTTTSTTHTSTGPHVTVTTSSPQSTTITHPTITTTHRLSQPSAPQPAAAPTAIPPERRSSIRIRRQGTDSATQTVAESNTQGNRRRSSSEPQPPQLSLAPLPPLQDDLEIRRHVSATPLQTLHEEGSGNEIFQLPSGHLAVPARAPRRPGMARQRSAISLRQRGPGPGQHAPEYDTDMVDVLDVIDPEVSTLTTLNNVQNSLFIPNLPSWFYNRQPTYNLSRRSPYTSDEEAEIGEQLPKEGEEKEQAESAEEEETGEVRPSANRLATTNTISSVLTGMSEGHNYAVLPHGASLPGWTAEEKAMLNDHVRHLLHSRRAKFKRSMRGFGQYIKKPVGFLITLYAFLLTFWGAAWVLFLIGWISVKGRQAYFIEICDQILTALFCVVGIGLAPWRAVDTYHMIYVAHYAHLTWKLRKKLGLPDLKDHNELPTRSDTHTWETGDEGDEDKPEEAPVLTAAQQQKLEHHQGKLAASHTFYKPHETTTHRAFSLRLLIAIVVLLDCHSMFQMALGGTTWGIYYKHRPKALTAVILSCSISCNISAGIVISIGDKRSRKKLVVEQMFRQGVTEDALKELRKEKGLVARGIGSQKKKDPIKEHSESNVGQYGL